MLREVFCKTFKKQITQLFLMGTIGLIPISALAQAYQVSMKKSNVPLSSVIKELEKESGYTFFYNDDQINLEKRISIDVTDAPLEVVLNQLFGNTEYTYRIVNNQIVISKIVNALERVAAKNTASQQKSITVKGTVNDTHGEPVIGASVVEAGTTNGTVTDFDGNFSLTMSGKDKRLLISYIGYATKKITLKEGQTSLNITLEEDSELLDEVVVVGYGTQKKATLTGAVASVSGENLLKRSVASMSTALQGAMPGVTIQQTSGQPGTDGSSIRIRGIGSINSNLDPLVLVDGIETDINQVDMNSVETISVLKDAASAAIYGSRASNGVVLITTKRGKDGKVSVGYSGYITIQQPTNMPEVVPAWEYLQAELDSWDNAGQGITPEQRAQQLELIQQQKQFRPDNWERYDTDWRKETMKDNAIMHSHSVQVNGGNENIQFFGVGSYLFQEGLIPNNNYDRTNLRLNTDAKLLSWAKLSVETSLRQSTTKEPGVSSPKAIINKSLYMLPTLSGARELDGNWGFGKNGDNPTAQAHESGYKNHKGSEVLVNGTLTLNPLEGLNIIGQYSIRILSKRDRNLVLPYKVYLKGQYMGKFPGEDNLTEGWNQNTRNYYKVQASYDKKIQTHDFKILVGIQAEDNIYTDMNASKKGFNLGYYYLSNGDNSTSTTSGGANSWSMLSYFGRINYNYAEKYLLELTGRYDGSSRFTPSNRWGFFPSVSAGWVISKETFMEGTSDVLNQLKIRASYGLLGNQGLNNNYPYASTIISGSKYSYWFNKDLSSGVAQIALSNNNVSWEKSKQFNIGMDITLWNGKLGIVADYYRKNIYDMLMQFPLPYYGGMKAAWSNAGDMENRGWEIALSHRNQIGEVSYGVTLTLNDNRNKITNLRGLLSQNKELMVDYPKGGIWGYQTDGYFQTWEEIENSPQLSNSTTPGYIKYVKVNKEDNVDPMKIDSRDQVYLGDPFPHFEYGLNLNGAWKNIDLSIFFQGVGQRSTYMGGIGLKPFTNGSNLFRHQMDSWTPENPNAKYPILLPESNANDNFVKSDKWVRNGAYCRLKNIQLGYTLPKNWTKRAMLESLRFYVSGQNLFTISNFYKGYDPEVSYTGDTGGEFYPIMRTFTFGIDLRF